MNEIVGKCEGLSAEDESRVRDFMSEVAANCEGRHILKMRNTHFRPFPDNDGGRFDEACVSHHMQLCESEHKTVASWVAQPFIEPETRYFETHEFTPEPTVWIEATLSDGKRSYKANFACSPTSDGRLLACNWVLRSKRKKRQPRKLTREELSAVPDATVAFNAKETYEVRIRRYCEQNGIAIPVGFALGTRSPPQEGRYAVIDLAKTPPQLVAGTFHGSRELVRYLDRTGIDWKADTSPQMRVLDFKTGRLLYHVGGWRLKKGPSFVRK